MARVCSPAWPVRSISHHTLLLWSHLPVAVKIKLHCNCDASLRTHFAVVTLLYFPDAYMEKQCGYTVTYGDPVSHRDVQVRRLACI